MSQNIERIINQEDVEIFSVTADRAMSGAALEKIGIWYSSAELTQIISALERAKTFLGTQEE